MHQRLSPPRLVDQMALYDSRAAIFQLLKKRRRLPIVSQRGQALDVDCPGKDTLCYHSK